MLATTTLQTEQKIRIGLIGAVFLLLITMVLGRLVQRQIFEYPHFAALAREQHTISQIVPAQRGKILAEERDDNSFYPLATNVTLWALTAVPNQIKRPELVASKLMPYLENIEEADLVTKLSSGAVYLAPLKQRLDEAEAKEINDLNLTGVHLTPEKYRYYPEETMAAHLLGFVNRDNLGQYGVESYFNRELGGKAGFLEAEQDTFGQQIALGKRSTVNPEDGLDIVVSIDRAIQYYVERELKAAVEQHQAEKGSVIIMDPKTGQIVAMAAYPTFDPNNYNTEDIDKFTNMNISQVYEPGSVFKVITMAAGIDAGLVSPSTT
ncbi:MAG: penicillin-binding transpeptidase domain-containing protein, partial [bacterium]